MLKVSFQRNDRERALQQLPSTGWLQEFQRKLHEKAKAEPKYRFYSLYDKMYRMEVLVEAYRKAKANRGASGVDEETFEDVEKKGVGAYLVRSRKTGTRLILVYPSPRSLERFRARVRECVDHSLPLRVQEQVEDVNRYLRGWVGYFRLGNASATFRKLARFVNLRVRHVIWRRRGSRGYGMHKLTSDYIYDKLGLYYDYAVVRL